VLIVSHFTSKCKHIYYDVMYVVVPVFLQLVDWQLATVVYLISYLYFFLRLIHCTFVNLLFSFIILLFITLLFIIILLCLCCWYFSWHKNFLRD